MTGSLPSWSPLNDPQLSAQIQARLANGQEKTRVEAQRDLYFLERFEWREYPAKCGRWHLGEAGSFTLTGGSNLSGPWTKMDWSPDYRWVLLLDPASRQPIAAHIVNDWWVEDPKARQVVPVANGVTSFWFAGNPLLGGMFTPAGNGHRAVFGYRSGHSEVANFVNWTSGPARFEQLAAQAASWTYTDKVASEFGPWLADQPQQPPRPRRFSRLTWQATTPTQP